jgi:ABC-type transport system involved in multi-copper enzyme maturation permease subunit
MIRFAWQQSRTQTFVAVGLLAAIAIAALITGIQLSHIYSDLVTRCQSNCGLAIQQYLSRYTFMDHTLDLLARAVPALFGLFWGAPLLAREFETGTYRLAWTQSVPRTRWLLIRLGVGALDTAVLAGLFSLTITWWYHSRDKVGSNIYEVFDRREIAPVAYALFAFAAGVMFGALIRRTVPAMAATLGLFVFARIAVDLWVRPYLLGAKHATVTLAREGPVQLGIGTSNGGAVHLFAQGGGPDNSWTQSSHFITLAGRPLSAGQMTAFLQQHCGSLIDAAAGPLPVGKVPADDAGAQCLAQVTASFRLAIAYQPAGRYWTFQWLETAIFIALGLIATGVTYWRVTRKSR